MNKHTFTWKVSDGYIGHGPHKTSIDLDEIKECDSNEEAAQLVEEAIEESFREKVSWSTDEEILATVSKIRNNP